MARRSSKRETRYSLLTEWYSTSGKKYDAGSDLYAWYQFEKDVSTSGSPPLPDLSGNGRDLTPEGGNSADQPLAPTDDNPGRPSPPGFPAKSTQFSNDSQEFVDPSGTDDFSFGSPSSNSDSPFSIEVWVKSTSTNITAVDQYVAGKYNRGDDTREWLLFLNNGKPTFYLSSDGTNTNRISADVDTVLESNKWYHIVATYDGSATKDGISIYVNSQHGPSGTNRYQAGSYNGMTGSTTAIFTVGNSDDESTTYDFIGKLAQLAIWSKCLSTEEVNALTGAALGIYSYRSGISSPPARLQLMEKDRMGYQHPWNLRLGDQDAQSSLKSLPYDDTNTITFLSNFAIGKIHVTDDIIPGTSVDITGSDGSFAKRFRFIETVESPGTDFDPSDVTVLLGTDESVSRNQRIRTSVRNLQKAISAQTDLKMTARYQPAIIERYHSDGIPREERVERHTIVLQHKEPMTGSYLQGNLLSTNRFVVPGTSLSLAVLASQVSGFKVEQFRIGTTSPITLGTLSPQDGLVNESIVSAGHSSPSITSNGSHIPGITDATYRSLKNYVISPFDESRIPSFKDDRFHNQGTHPSILEGFEGRLSSKTIFKIGCRSSNPAGDAIHYATRSASGLPLGTYTPAVAGKQGSGFAYWAPGKRQWEMKGIHLGDLDINAFSHQTLHRAKTTVGFSLIPSHSLGTESAVKLWFHKDNAEHNRDTIETLRSTSLPISTYGFPFAAQYNATSSQEILMSDYITGPFLLEKMKVEIKGIFGVGTSSLHPLGSSDSKAYLPPINKTFFVVNQMTSGDNPHVTGSYQAINYREETEGAYQKFHFTHHQRGHREVVGWGKIGFFDERNRVFNGAAKVEDVDKLYNDYDLVQQFSTSDMPAFTGTLSLNIEPRLGLASDFIVGSTVMDNPDGIRKIIQSNPHGGADLRGNASGRQIASSIGSVKAIGTGSHQVINRITEKERHYQKSPYLLLPKDRLIFGWQNLMSLQTDVGSTPGLTSQAQGDLLVDRIQEVNVTLFGSMVRKGREFHDTLNQNLSTNQIQELIFGEHVVDQFDVEPISVLSGSTLDALFFGTMDPNAVVRNAGVRGRRASIAQGQAGSTGSLQRNASFKSTGRLKDTLTPHIEFLLSNRTFFSGTADTSGPASGVSHSVSVGANTYKSIVLSNNPASSSYNLLKFVGLHQLTNPVNQRDFVSNLRVSPASDFLTPPGGGKVSDADFLSFDMSTSGPASYKVFSGTLDYALGVNSFGSPEIFTPPAFEPPTLYKSRDQKIAISSLFFAAPVASMFGRLSWPVHKQGLGVFPAIRAAKYGLSSTSPKSPSAYFRRTRFGQFRDFMEQHPETAVVGLVDENTGKVDLEAADGPVRVRFFARNGTPDIDPHDTNSHNLSQFATSSMPFFDGLIKERDVINFPPPDDTDVTTISEAVSAIIDGDA